ncbi:uncharacterized protein ARMOST_17699 [Armillaria ostoyae]|uniref:Tyr recombinase domain-containing protein n=1 Tax=Armillaria ostoyae TaxID=47428 RepID=A0A284RZP7_ARMOS|nr:uncharacterized protein ARMOST_17699 [Armillaria ostoyae]
MADLAVPLDAAVAACLTTTFYSGARLGEFTLTNLGCFDLLVHCKRSDVQKPAFLTRLHKAFKDTKMEPLQGHGIRIGATLEYLLRGIPFDVIKTIGRWKSNAFTLYLQKHAQILAPYMQANP